MYVLIRAKREKSSMERLYETFSSALFDKLKVIDPVFIDKIKTIDGNLEDSNEMGISQSDQLELIENVEIVIHLAANVRFDAPLQEICLVNVRGTRTMLMLVKQMQKLMAFIYMSTAFAFCNKQNIEEQFGIPPIDPNDMIRIVEYFERNEMDTEMLNILTEKLILGWPNTYSFSKAIAEELIRQASVYIPVAIIRPSIG